MSAILAWHFVGATLRDGRPVPPDGEWLVHDGPVKMCESGLHASRDAFDALFYAPGNVLCRVECDDIIEEESDKLVCRRRRILRRIDAGPLLRDYASWCALRVIHLWNAPPVVREYLESGDEHKRADAEAAASRRRSHEHEHRSDPQHWRPQAAAARLLAKPGVELRARGDAWR